MTVFGRSAILNATGAMWPGAHWQRVPKRQVAHLPEPRDRALAAKDEYSWQPRFSRNALIFVSNKPWWYLLQATVVLEALTGKALRIMSSPSQQRIQFILTLTDNQESRVTRRQLPELDLVRPDAARGMRTSLASVS